MGLGGRRGENGGGDRGLAGPLARLPPVSVPAHSRGFSRSPGLEAPSPPPRPPCRALTLGPDLPTRRNTSTT